MSVRRLRSTLLLGLASGLGLQGCASPPKPAPAPVVAAPAPAPEPPPVVSMAPIPNPPEPERSTHAAHSGAAHHTVHKAEPAPTAKPVAATPEGSPAVDKAKAARLRAAGLEQLNRGAINRAVALLQAAHQADPGSELIRRDLERALRISNAVHARH
jgi:hypothetical protein